MRIWSGIVIAAAMAGPAQADITGTYQAVRGKVKTTMRVEVAANGDLRVDTNFPQIYMVKHGARTYFVMLTGKGPLVEDLEDLSAVIQEETAKKDAHFCDKIRAGASSAALVARGEVTVAGRKGDAYATAARVGSKPDLVISHDPELAPLGAAWAAQLRLGMSLMGGCMGDVPMYRQLQALLDSGTAVAFGDLQLEKVEAGTIDPARFALPGPPATREQIRESMADPDAPRVTFEPRPLN